MHILNCLSYIRNAFSTFFSFLPKLSPGAPFSTTRQEMPLGPFPPVRHITMYTSVSPPPLMKAWSKTHTKRGKLLDQNDYFDIKVYCCKQPHPAETKWGKKKKKKKIPWSHLRHSGLLSAVHWWWGMQRHCHCLNKEIQKVSSQQHST